MQSVCNAEGKLLLSIERSLCGQCGGCVPVCFAEAIYLSPVSLEIDESRCNGCENCILFCPMGALKLNRERVL